MNSFFVLNNTYQISISEDYAGYVVFYKKSKEESVEQIQTDLYKKLIENALKLKLDNFLFIDISENKKRFSTLKKSISIKKVFLFGVEEKEVGINLNIPFYQLITVASVDFLKADAPEVLETDKKLKNLFWTQLQIAFKLN